MPMRGNVLLPKLELHGRVRRLQWFVRSPRYQILAKRCGNDYVLRSLRHLGKTCGGLAQPPVFCRNFFPSRRSTTGSWWISARKPTVSSTSHLSARRRIGLRISRKTRFNCPKRNSSINWIYCRMASAWWDFSHVLRGRRRRYYSLEAFDLFLHLVR